MKRKGLNGDPEMGIRPKLGAGDEGVKCIKEWAEKYVPTRRLSTLEPGMKLKSPDVLLSLAVSKSLKPTGKSYHVPSPILFIAYCNSVL